MRKIFVAAVFNVAFVFTLLAGSGAASAQAPIPDTAAGRVLEAWLVAFNSGDRARIEAFVDRYGWPQPVDGLVSFRSTTGGFDLLGIERSEPRSIDFLVKERASETRAIGRLRLAGEPPRISDATLRAIPPGAKMLGFDIDASMRDSVIDGAIAKLREHYVYEDTAQAMADALERRRRRGDYDAVTSSSELAELLTAHLREVSNDLHLRVNFSHAAVRPGRAPGR